MKKEKEHQDFILRGSVISTKKNEGIAGISIHAINFNSKKTVGNVISNEDGGFHFIFRSDDKDSLNKISLVAYDIENKEILKVKEIIQITWGEQKEIKLNIKEDDIQDHLNKCISMKPTFGRVFPTEKLDEIYSSINLYGNTLKKYFSGGNIKPGLTCPFPEIENFEHILDDAWNTIQGDVIAIDRFRNSLDSINLSKSKSGAIKLNIDFEGEDWKNFIESIKAKQKYSIDENNAIIPLKHSALLMTAANTLGKKDKSLSNHYMNVALEQIMGYFEVSSIYNTAHYALRGDKTAQSNIRSMISIWGEDCGETGPFPISPDDRGEWDPSKPIDPNLEAQLACIDELMRGNRDQDPFFDFEIYNLTPNNACAGDTAIIRGRGLGNIIGKVQFVGTTINSRLFATPTRWTDTEIELQIPNNATYGPISLVLPNRNAKVVCGHVVGTIPRDDSNRPTYFFGGKPRIDGISFMKNNVVFDPDTETANPGDSITLIYENTPNAPTHNVTVEEAVLNVFNADGSVGNGQFGASSSIENFNVLYNGFGGYPRRIETFVLKNYSRSAKISVDITLSNYCGTAFKTKNFIVHLPSSVLLTGMEITQAIQFFRSDEVIPNENERQPDNSVFLIGDKPTLVRVYSNSNQVGSFNNGCTFGLDIKLRGFKDGIEFSNSPITAINSNVLFASSDNSTDFQKGNSASSANFLLPGNWITPSRTFDVHSSEFHRNIPLKLTVELSIRPFEPWIRDNVDLGSNTLTTTGINFFTPARSLQCVLVRIAYEGPDHGSTNPPTHEECVNVLNDIMHAYPTAELDIFLPSALTLVGPARPRPPSHDDDVFTFDGDLTDEGDGGCGPGWGGILTMLDNKNQSHEVAEDAVWVALLDPSIPTIVAAGCGGGGLAAFPVSLPKVGMQEIGHAFGRSHSFEDDNYPEYGYPNFSDDPDSGDDSIGDFGVDVGGFTSSLSTNNLQIYNPRNTADFMSYLSKPKWISPYTYQSLMGNFVIFDFPIASGSTSHLASITTGDKSEQIVISGSINLNTNEVNLRPLYHQRRFKKTVKGKPTNYFIVLLNEFDRILLKTAILEIYENGDDLRISQTVPFYKDVKHIEIRQNDKTLTRITRSDKLATISNLTLSERKNIKTLEWKIESKENTFWCGVELTCDNGKSWTRLNEIKAITSFSFDTTKSGGGKKCRLRVFVTDGFNTTYKETDTFSLPIKPPQIVPINFNDESEFIAGLSYELQAQPIYILGVAHQTELIWYLNEKNIGKGKKISISFEAGKHTIKVVSENYEDAAITVRIIVKKVE